MKHYQATRGWRNNNPLNIRRGEQWSGLASKQTDPQFCQFLTMTYGYRAGVKLLKSYARIFAQRGERDKPLGTTFGKRYRCVPAQSARTDAPSGRQGHTHGAPVDKTRSATGSNHAGGNDVRGMRLSALGSPYRLAEHGLHSRRSLRPAPHHRMVVK